MMQGMKIVRLSGLRMNPDGSDDGPDKSGCENVEGQPDLSGKNPAIRFQAEDRRRGQMMQGHLE
jgi:hypothetical protein